MGYFYRGRVQFEGRCGCQWTYIEPDATEDVEDAIAMRVKDEVTLHARRLGHAPRFIEIREDCYQLEPDEAEHFQRAAEGLERESV